MTNSPAEYPGYRIVEIQGLGQAAIVVHARRQKLVLMDAMLSADDRYDVMDQLLGVEEVSVG